MLKYYLKHSINVISQTMNIDLTLLCTIYYRGETIFFPILPFQNLAQNETDNLRNKHWRHENKTYGLEIKTHNIYNK